MRNALMLFALTSAFNSTLPAQPATASGELTVEPPTLVSLGFEWKISGDDNRNAKVETAYRKKGEAAWLFLVPVVALRNEGGSQFLPPSS